MISKRISKALLFLGMVLFALSPVLLYAQVNIPSPVTFTISQAPDTVKAGERFDVTIDATVEENWHLYSITPVVDGPIPTSFSAPGDTLFIAGDIRETEPEINYDPNFKMDIGWHSYSATFVVPVAFSTSISGQHAVRIDVRYMVCDDRVCLPPTTRTLVKTVFVDGVADDPFIPDSELASNTEASSSESAGNVGTESVAATLSEGVSSFIWLAITAGFAALLTPCVFPLIPLTVSFFSKDNTSRGKAAAKAGLFGISIIATFTILGVILSLVLGASGANQFAANPWVNLFIGLIFIIFAISLLGLFELQLPYTVTNWLNRKSNQSTGFLGILFMGLTISAVSFSCTAPFVGAILAATTQGQWFYPIIGMIAFSAAFASPFIIFALFPNWMQSLPRSGSWMNSVKVILGFIELAAAFKFISNADLVWQWGLVTRPLTIAVWIILSAMAGFYLLGKLRMAHDGEPKPIGTVSLLFSIPFLAFAIYLVPGLFGSNLGIWDAWLPPKSARDIGIVMASGMAATSDEGWSKDYESSKNIALEKGMPVFIDFTGYTCTNCRAMESNVFPLTGVRERFEKFELVKLYTDDGIDGPENQIFQFQLTGTVALPTYAIVDPETGKLLDIISGYVSEEEFTTFMDRGLSRFDQLR
jgi:thiol:disulfide interchange protein DsbD